MPNKTDYANTELIIFYLNETFFFYIFSFFLFSYSPVTKRVYHPEHILSYPECVSGVRTIACVIHQIVQNLFAVARKYCIFLQIYSNKL